MQLKMIGDRRR